MEELARKAAANALPDSADDTPSYRWDRLAVARVNLLDPRNLKLFSNDEIAAFRPLIDMAVAHVDRMKTELGLDQLPWQVALFGRAWLTKSGLLQRREKDGSVTFATGSLKNEALPLPEMKYGQPVDYNLQITTGRLGALLLYREGNVCMVPPYHYGNLSHLGLPLQLDPDPIFEV
jgi:hypothetical protein